MLCQKAPPQLDKNLSIFYNLMIWNLSNDPQKHVAYFLIFENAKCAPEEVLLEDVWKLGLPTGLSEPTKKNKAKIFSVSKSPLLSYHVLGLDGTLQEKVKSADNFNPLTPKISWVILPTVCHTIYVMIVWRIWNWINQ